MIMIFLALRKIVLQQTSSINDSGGLVWQLVLAYFGIYLIVYLMLVKGIKVIFLNLWPLILWVKYGSDLDQIWVNPFGLIVCCGRLE